MWRQRFSARSVGPTVQTPQSLAGDKRQALEDEKRGRDGLGQTRNLPASPDDLGGVAQSSLTCQMIPPGVLGIRWSSWPGKAGRSRGYGSESLLGSLASHSNLPMK